MFLFCGFFFQVYPSSYVRGCTSADTCRGNSSFWCCEEDYCNYSFIKNPTDRADPSGTGPNGGTNDDGNVVGCAVNDENCLNPPDTSGTGGGADGAVVVLDYLTLQQLGKGLILHPQGDPNSSNRFRLDALTVYICFITTIYLSWMVCRSRT